MEALTSQKYCFDKHSSSLNYQALLKTALQKPLKHHFSYQHFLNTGAVSRLPHSVAVELSSLCQLSCIMCDRAAIKRQYGIMPDHIFKMCIEQIGTHQIGSNFNVFGETLLDNNLISRIVYAKKNGVPNIRFVTNGVLLNEKMCNELITNGLDTIVISFDSANKATFEKIRKGADYIKIVRNIKNLVKTKEKLNAKNFKIRLRVTIFKDNISEVLDIFRQWHGVVTEIVLNFAYQYGHLLINHFMNIDWNEKIVCPAIIEKLAIHTNGDVTLCCGSDINGELKTGNILNDSLEYCYSGSIAREVRDMHLNLEFNKLPVCKQCSYTTKNRLYLKTFSQLIKKQCVEIVENERMNKNY